MKIFITKWNTEKGAIYLVATEDNTGREGDWTGKVEFFFEKEQAIERILELLNM